MLVPWPYFVNQSFKLRNLTVALLILFAQNAGCVRFLFAQNAGCVRFLWNELNALNTKEYKAYQDYLKAVEAVKDDPKKVDKIPKVERPSLRTFDVINKLIDIKKEHPFLKNAPSQALQQEAKIWARTMRGAVSGKNGFPKQKKKYDLYGRAPQLTNVLLY